MTRSSTPKILERFSSLPSIFGYLGKETKNIAGHVVVKLYLYLRTDVRLNRRYGTGFVLSGSALGGGKFKGL